jgi:hypothetical protein
VKNLELLRKRTRKLLRENPIKFLFPDEPWEMEDFVEIAHTIETYIITENQVITDDDDPFADWLDRFRFYEAN